MTSTSFLVRNIPAADAEALRAQADAEGVSMNDIALRALHDAVTRRARLRAYLAEIDTDHADTLAALADR